MPHIGEIESFVFRYKEAELKVSLKGGNMNGLMEKLYACIQKQGWFSYGRVYKQMAWLYAGNSQEIEGAVKHYYISNLKNSLAVAITGLLLGGILLFADAGKEKNELTVVRNSYGEEETTYTIRYQDADDNWQELPLIVEAVQYRDAELESVFQAAFQYLEKTILGSNAQAEQIQTDLNLITNVPESGITVRWSSDNYEILDEKGVVHNEGLTEVQVVNLKAELQYEEVQKSKEYRLIIYPKELTEADIQRQELLAELTSIAQEHVYEKEFTIPTQLQGVKLRLNSSIASRGIILIIMGIGMAVLLWLRQQENLQTQRKRQQKELQREYAGMVNQILLYIGAGTTIKGAFERILLQYEKRPEVKGALYRNLLIMQNEMHAGISQGQAYLNMGRRTGLLSYIRLTTLLAQQIQKGSSNLTLQLEQEQHAAFEQRKEQAKKYGEEAGTKLLFPMIILMVISMILVVGPAVLNVTL